MVPHQRPLDELWRLDAACRSEDPDIFFPPQGNPGHDAKRVCARCPVQTACLETALTYERGLTYSFRIGVWGGMTSRERAREARRRRIEGAA